MDHSTQQNQEIHLSDSLESMEVCQKTQPERKPNPQQEQALKCPRCDSINTKFCNYNNNSLTQPGYFCRSCRIYWTKGGTLRYIPVGGGCKKRSLNDQPSALDPTMASYYDSSDFGYSFGQPHYSENFNLVSGFENHCSSDTFKNRFIESYLSSRRSMQSGFENAVMGRAEKRKLDDNGCDKNGSERGSVWRERNFIVRWNLPPNKAFVNSCNFRS